MKSKSSKLRKPFSKGASKKYGPTGVGQITRYAKWLIAKKESPSTYFGPPISRKSCGNKSRYDVCGMSKTSCTKKSKSHKSILTKSKPRIVEISDSCLNHYYNKHDVFGGRTKGDGAVVIFPTYGSHKRLV
jgi:hypothetical protein